MKFFRRGGEGVGAAVEAIKTGFNQEDKRKIGNQEEGQLKKWAGEGCVVLSPGRGFALGVRGKNDCSMIVGVVEPERGRGLGPKLITELDRICSGQSDCQIRRLEIVTESQTVENVAAGVGYRVVDDHGWVVRLEKKR